MYFEEIQQADLSPSNRNYLINSIQNREKYKKIVMSAFQLICI
jgi:hypothetical protein